MIVSSNVQFQFAPSPRTLLCVTFFYETRSCFALAPTDTVQNFVWMSSVIVHQTWAKPPIPISESKRQPYKVLDGFRRPHWWTRDAPFLGHWFAMPPPPQNVSPTLSGLAGLIASMLSVVLLSFASKTAFAHPWVKLRQEAVGIWNVVLAAFRLQKVAKVSSRPGRGYITSKRPKCKHLLSTRERWRFSIRICIERDQFIDRKYSIYHSHIHRHIYVWVSGEG